jgi:hypothetical protein
VPSGASAPAAGVPARAGRYGDGRHSLLSVLGSSLSFARRLLSALALVLLAAPAVAQPVTGGGADARLHLGPLALDPRLSVRDVGIDTNIFNDAEAPVRDFTAVIGPELDSWVRLGRLYWSGTSAVRWNYYRENRSQRSIDLAQDGRLDLDLGIVMPFVRGHAGRTRQRPNLEIDARVQLDTRDLAGGFGLRFGPSTFVSLEHGARQVEFGDVRLGEATLAETLNRTETSSRVALQRALTPLTTLNVAAEYRSDDFETAVDRDSESYRLVGGLDLRPLALVAGRALVGVRSFRPDSPMAPRFTGTVADVELTYQFRDLTRLMGLVARDIDYSYDPAQAYYVSTAWRLSAIQALGPGWDITAHAGRTRLAYRSRLDATIDERDRRDHVLVYGLGFGRRLGTDMRVGVEIEYGTRRSSVRDRTYEGLRGGGTFSYGF